MLIFKLVPSFVILPFFQTLGIFRFFGPIRTKTGINFIPNKFSSQIIIVDQRYRNKDPFDLQPFISHLR